MPRYDIRHWKQDRDTPLVWQTVALTDFAAIQIARRATEDGEPGGGLA
jgi:hypothetical protein